MCNTVTHVLLSRRGTSVQHYAQCELLPREDPVSPDARAAHQFARA